jgi:hypothetical protein
MTRRTKSRSSGRIPGLDEDVDLVCANCNHEFHSLAPHVYEIRADGPLRSDGLLGATRRLSIDGVETDVFVPRYLESEGSWKIGC